VANDRATNRAGRTAIALLGVVLLALAPAASVSALPYDGTNPKHTVCGDGTYKVYTLGLENAAGGPSDEGDPQEILTGSGALVGTVAIRHSRVCATVWAEVKNLLGVTVEMKEALVTYSDSNGAGRSVHWYPTVDTAGPGVTGWSNQYRDRASFSAIGQIKYNGVWYSYETPRSVAWVQMKNNFPGSPYQCNGTITYACNRWPVTSTGGSVTREYHLNSNLANMPNGSGVLDVRSDVVFMFDKFNAVAGAANPTFNQGTLAQAEVKVFSYWEEGIVARAGGFDDNGDHLYDRGELKLSTYANWPTHNSARGTLCHEIDHLMGLNHVWQSNATVENIGSKATCIGMGSDTGPRTDDVSALVDVYSGGVP
jgi:hypothetical protein